MLLGLSLVLILFLDGQTLAEPYKDRVQKREYIKEHGGHRSETGVRSGKYQVEFGDRHNWEKTFDRAEKNQGTRKPKAVIDAPKHQRPRIKSEAKRRGIELDFEEE